MTAKLSEKLDLEVRLLSKLKELQKAWEEVSDLQGKIALAQAEHCFKYRPIYWYIDRDTDILSKMIG